MPSYASPSPAPSNLSRRTVSRTPSSQGPERSRYIPLLPFQKQIIREISEPGEDDLVVIAAGLGLRRIVAAVMKLYDGEKNLIILVNATPADEASLGEHLSLLGVRKPGLRVVGFETDGKARKTLYEQGGLISVTSRILVVDMLTKNIPTSLITGLVMLHADRVSATSLEAFVVRLYRQDNRNGFLKSFTSNPPSSLQTLLRLLSTRRSHLYPRFHQSVHQSLGQRRADVVELYVPMGEGMKEVMGGLVEVLGGVVAELRRSCVGIDLEEFTTDNALFKSFDRTIRMQLDPVWHRVGAGTRRLVQDLGVLRGLMTYLLSYDAVTFNSYLETIIASNSSTSKVGVGGGSKQQQSAWLFMDAADVMIRAAKARCYEKQPSLSRRETATATPAREPSAAPSDVAEEEGWEAMDDVERTTNGALEDANKRNRKRSKWPEGVTPVLEELPKWGVLAQVLEEIETEIEYTPEVDTVNPGSNAVLVMCSSDRTCTQLREYLSTMKPFAPGRSENDITHAGQKMMERMLRTYFFWKNGLHDLGKSFKEVAEDVRKGRLVEDPDGADALYEKFTASTLKRSAEGTNGAPASGSNGSAQGFRRGGAPPNKRRRVRGGSANAIKANNRGKERNGEDKEIVGEGEMEDEAEEIADFLRASQTPGPSGAADPISISDDEDEPILQPIDPTSTATTLLQPSVQETLTDAFDASAYDEFFGLLAPEETVIIRPYGGDDDEMVLKELRPRFIVMYDADPAFVRMIEVYRSSNPGLGVRVYFMMYADSVEEQRYLAGLRKEKDAFERLIREKGTMMIPLMGDPRAPYMAAAPSKRGGVMSTRNAGGSGSEEQSRVIIDIREFRSTLPSLLHSASITIVPATLQVGDYVLSPEMCVERKSVPDLISSFLSGRLYTQCEAMSVHYAQPILLIEFEENKSFSLQTMVDQKTQPTSRANSASSGSRNDPNQTPKASSIDPLTIQSKLVLLTLHFPRLRIIWSSSPWATVDIIADLKAGHAEPDASRAIGAGGEEDGADTGMYNTGAVEVLRSLPGVNARNWKLVVGRVGSVKELCGLEAEEIGDVLGGEEGGKDLVEFLEKKGR